jgi:hypothetical protein
MRNHYIFLIIGLLAANVGNGQISLRVISFDTLVSEVRPADFHPLSPVVDSNANVVVLRDSGSADLEGGFAGWQVRQKRYRRLLIRNKNGFDAAKINLSYDLGLNLFGIRFHGYTCNLVGDSVVKTVIDTSEIFFDMTSIGWMKERISFPNVKEGSIIEYSYSIVSHSIYTFHPWTFQGEYPCLKSTYRMSFPAVFNYVVTKQGYLPIARADSAWDSVYQIGMKAITTKCYAIRWEMTNVPAFREEPYISAPDNYVSAIRFQLNEYPDLEKKKEVKVYDTWNEVNKDLYKSKSFGGIMTASSHWLRKEMRTIVNDTVNGMDKARALYAYVRDHFTNMGRDIVADEDQSLKDIFKSHKGSVAEINLLLTAMLREEGLTADAVILSTRDNGKITPSYPVMENFNYVVVRLKAGDETYYLDASEPRMGFGHLPAECYNGYARVVSEKPDSVDLDADSLSEFKISMLMLTNNDHGDSLSGTYSAQHGYYGSEDIRDEIADKDEKSYFEGERKSYPFPVGLTDRRVDSLKQYDLPVTVHYTLGFPIGDEDRIYFNPMMGEGMKENLFSAAERHYPIEMPFKMDELFVMRMEIPKGYAIEEMPKAARVLLGDGDGSYEYLFQVDDETIQFRSRLVLKQTFFLADAYQPLRDFYAAVMKKQGEVIVFKKKK